MDTASQISTRGRAEPLENRHWYEQQELGAKAQIEVVVRDAIMSTSAGAQPQMAAAGRPVPRFGAAALTCWFLDVVPQIR